MKIIDEIKTESFPIFQTYTYEVLIILTKLKRKEHTKIGLDNFIMSKEKKKNLLSDTSMRTLSTRSKTKNLSKKLVSKKNYISIRINFFVLS